MALEVAHRPRRSAAAVVYDEDVLEARASQQLSLLPSMPKAASENVKSAKPAKHTVESENVDPQIPSKATAKKQRTKRAAEEAQPVESPKAKKPASSKAWTI